MKGLCWAVVPVLFVAVFTAQILSKRQEQQPVQEESGEVQLPEPEPQPRVVGQARDQEEWAEWQKIELNPDSAQEAELARQFIVNHPESGLVPNAHHVIARHYFQLNDVENFVTHAEKAVAEIPEALDLLTQLAFFYSETGRDVEAVERANQALQVLETLEKPPGMPAVEWVAQRYQVRAEANYALGRAFLTRMAGPGDRNEDPNLRKAVEHLNQALVFEPKHDYACFRLGFAYRNLNDAGGALVAYAKAAAVGGIAAGPARNALNEIHAIVKEGMPDSAWAGKEVQEIISDASLELSAAEARRNDEIAQKAQEIEAQEFQWRRPATGEDSATPQPLPSPPPQ